MYSNRAWTDWLQSGRNINDFNAEEKPANH